MGGYFFFDVYHALAPQSPPKVLINSVLLRLGTPTKLLRLRQTLLEFGSSFFTGTPDEIFRTTHGVKQGCLLSCFLVVGFEVSLHFLRRHNMCLSAFVDDTSSPVPPNRGTQVASLVQRVLSLIGCQLNVSKSESLALTRPAATPPILPNYSHPPSPMQASSGF